MKKILSSYSSIGILYLFIILYTLFWYYYPHEFIVSDPWAYSSRAFQIGQDFNFGSGHVFDHRLGLTIPVAIFYKLFGISMLTTNLWPLMAVIIIFITVWFALPDSKSKLIGLILCFFSVPFLKASTTLFPDIIATAFMASSSLLLFKREKIVLSKYWLFLSILTIVFLFVSFLAKESAYWIIPLWIIYFINDLKEKNNNLLKRFYLPIFLICVLLGFLYLIMNYYIWGSPLARFESVQSLTGKHLWSSVNMSSSDFIKRLTTAPIKFLFNEFYWFPLLALISFWVVPKHLMGWAYYVILCLGFFWFGTTSFSQYEPMPLVGRMVLPALPGIYILSAFFISKINLSFSRLPIGKNIASIVFLLFLILPSVKYFHKINTIVLHENNAMNIIKNKLIDNPEEKYILICVESYSTRALSFYFSYEYPVNLEVINFDYLNNELLSGRKIFIFVDDQRSNFLNSAYGFKKYNKQIESLHLKEIYNGNYVHLYEIHNKNEIESLLSFK